MLSSSQASARQFLFQRTQGAQVAHPGLSLSKLLVQGAHLCEERACVLVVLAASLGDQSFSPLPVQLDGLTWTQLFGGPGDLKGDVAEAVIPIALVVGVAVAILLRYPFQQVQGAVNIPFIQGDLDQERGVPGRSGLLQEREQLQLKRLPAIETFGKISQF